jgi:hypothetical protein
VKRTFIICLVAVGLACGVGLADQGSLPVLPELPGNPVLQLEPDAKAADSKAAKDEGKEEKKAAAAEPAAVPQGNPYWGERWWFRGEYLLWFPKPGHEPFALATTSSALPDGAAIGALGSPGTTVLFGPASLDYDSASGMRLSLGRWFGDDQIFGVEGTLLVVERTSADEFRALSRVNGVPSLYVPFIDATTSTATAVPISEPSVVLPNSGGILITSTSRMWGAEINGVAHLAETGRLSADVFTGFRYLDLDEDLELRTTTQIFPQTVIPALSSTALVQTSDRFAVYNHFYGGQIGGRVTLRRSIFSLNLGGSIAIGGTNQVVKISGSTAQFFSGFLATVFPNGVFNGGILAQGTNIGRFERNQFAVVPEIQVQLGVQLTPAIRGLIGYNFLYLSDVLRPGTQIDPVVNPSQNAAFPLAGPGVLTGPARPAPILGLSETSYWVQGINLGLELKY